MSSRDGIQEEHHAPSAATRRSGHRPPHAVLGAVVLGAMVLGAMRNRVLLLGVVELVFVLGGLRLIAREDLERTSPSLAMLATFAFVLLLLALLPRVYVEFRRHAFQVTPADAAMLVGLFVLGPLAFVAVGMLAESVAALKHRQSPLKTGFNLVQMFGGLVAAGTTFALIGRTDPSDPVAWLAGGAAIAACVVWDLLSTAAVLAVAEGQRLNAMLVRLAPMAAVGLLVAAMLGTAALVLFNETPFGPVLFAPVLAILVISTRAVARQRAERLHFERLYAASSHLAELVSLEDMLGRIATEARTLVTGAAAICGTVRADGTAVGMLVDDAGVRRAPDGALAALDTLTAAADEGQGEVTELDGEAQTHLPPSRSLVWAARPTPSGARVVVAAFRELPNEESDRHQAAVLTAFVSHAAAVVANVGLHEEVQDALHRQVALNRQKGEFVAAVSHELRTPLAAMIGSVQTVRRLADRLSDADRNRVLEMGLSQGVRLQGLIEDLLLVAAADHRELELDLVAVSPPALFRSIQLEMMPIVGTRLSVAVDPATPTMLGDEDKLRRIVLNLIDNARKYAPDGPIELRAFPDDGRAVVTVRDHGPGIAESDRDRIFERFVQLDQSSTRRQGGTGLGLYLCRELATCQGGSLEHEAPRDGGSRFVLRLPSGPELPSATNVASVAARGPDCLPSRDPTGSEPRRGQYGLALRRPSDLPKRGVGDQPTPLDHDATGDTPTGFAGVAILHGER